MKDEKKDETPQEEGVAPPLEEESVEEVEATRENNDCAECTMMAGPFGGLPDFKAEQELQEKKRARTQLRQAEKFGVPVEALTPLLKFGRILSLRETISEQCQKGGSIPFWGYLESSELIEPAPGSDELDDRIVRVVLEIPFDSRGVDRVMKTFALTEGHPIIIIT